MLNLLNGIFVDEVVALEQRYRLPHHHEVGPL